MSELKRIDFDKALIETDNYKYKIAESIPVDKYQEFLIIQHEVSYGLNFQETAKQLNEIYSALNKVDFVQAAAIVHNLINSISKGIEKREDPIMRLCALFCIREDENPQKFDETMQKEKVRDLISGGYDFRDFFSFAVRLVPGLIDGLNKIFQSISEKTEQIQEKNKESIFGNLKLKPDNTGRD